MTIKSGNTLSFFGLGLLLAASVAFGAVVLSNQNTPEPSTGKGVWNGQLPNSINGIAVQPAGNLFLENYGLWCGGGHGGFQDCCNGTQCPSCQIVPTDDPQKLVTPECLKECPPADELDAICAWHDACTFTYEKPANFSCWPQGNCCRCDCIIVRKALEVNCTTYACTTYRSALTELFLHATACWFNSTDGPQCAGYTSRTPVMTFCNNSTNEVEDDTIEV